MALHGYYLEDLSEGMSAAFGKKKGKTPSTLDARQTHAIEALQPALPVYALFPKRINVQLAVPTGPKEIFILIWERGAGETQASGSSSCAAASACISSCRRGLSLPALMGTTALS